MFNPFIMKCRPNSVSTERDSAELRLNYVGTTWENSPESFRRKIKQDIINQQGSICSYCGNVFGKTSPGNIDHFLPKNEFPQFTFTPENLVLACENCNSSFKGTYNPYESDNCSNDYPSEGFKIVHPILDEPSEHFEISTTGLYLIFKTDKALESNRLFKLNNEGAIDGRARIINENKSIEISPVRKELISSIICKPRIWLQSFHSVP